MKEYRIVCDVRMLTHDGRERFEEAKRPWVNGTHEYHPYKTKAEAQKALTRIKHLAKEFDEKSQRELAIRDWAVGCWQSNFRIQSRTVTEWAD